jgi:hypothetical protein
MGTLFCFFFFLFKRAIFIGPSPIFWGKIGPSPIEGKHLFRLLPTPPPQLQFRNKCAPPLWRRTYIQFTYTRVELWGKKKKKAIWDKCEVLLGASWGISWERWEPHGNIMRTDCEQGKKKAQKLLSPAPLFSQTKQK